VFSHFEVAFALEFLSNGEMRVFEQILAISTDQTDHIVVGGSFLVHLNSLIRDFSRDVEFLSVFKVAFFFQTLRLTRVEFLDFVLRQIVSSDFISQIPFLGVDVHLEGVHRLSSKKVILFSQILLTNLTVVFSDLTIERSRHFRTLSLQ
jgi:hypothetical protein